MDKSTVSNKIMPENAQSDSYLLLKWCIQLENRAPVTSEVLSKTKTLWCLYGMTTCHLHTEQVVFHCGKEMLGVGGTQTFPGILFMFPVMSFSAESEVWEVLGWHALTATEQKSRSCEFTHFLAQDWAGFLVHKVLFACWERDLHFLTPFWNLQLSLTILPWPFTIIMSWPHGTILKINPLSGNPQVFDSLLLSLIAFEVLQRGLLNSDSVKSLCYHFKGPPHFVGSR